MVTMFPYMIVVHDKLTTQYIHCISQKQSQKTEALIRREFEKFHQFLWDEEEARIAELKEEEEQRSQIVKKKIDKITIQISSVMETINAIEKQIQGEDLLFLLVNELLLVQ